MPGTIIVPRLYCLRQVWQVGKLEQHLVFHKLRGNAFGGGLRTYGEDGAKAVVSLLAPCNIKMSDTASGHSCFITRAVSPKPAVANKALTACSLRQSLKSLWQVSWGNVPSSKFNGPLVVSFFKHLSNSPARACASSCTSCQALMASSVQLCCLGRQVVRRIRQGEYRAGAGGFIVGPGHLSGM